MSNEVRSEEKVTSPRRRTQIPSLLANQIKQEYLEGKGSIKELSNHCDGRETFQWWME